jgi:hypothetical protein
MINAQRVSHQHVFFVFCKNSQSKWSIFARKGWKHVYLIMSDGQHAWTYRPNGFNVVIEMLDLPSKKKSLKVDGKWLSLNDYLRKLSDLEGVQAIVGIDVEHYKGINDEQPFFKPGVTCAELCRLASGAKIGKAFTPYSLFRKLFRYTGVTNFNVFYRVGGSK